MRPALKSQHRAVKQDRTLRLSWPWWLQPSWPLLLLTGSMAVISAMTHRTSYAEAWGVKKYLDTENTTLLFLLIAVTLFGIMLTSGMATRGGQTVLRFTPTQVRYLRRAYKWLFNLTVLGYLMFVGIAFAQGVGLSDLAAVLQRDELAIYRVKAQIQTVAGLTTMTQFGPIAVVLGFILWKIGAAGKGFVFLVLLSGLRAVFYSERLALIEVVVPLVLVAALTVRRHSRAAKWISMAPLIIAPVVWVVFAASEYIRSWVHYQTLTALSFPEWITLRLLGYYTTSFNNSALFLEAHESTNALPYYSVSMFWNAPGVSSVVEHPGISDIDALVWWPTKLEQYGNPEFNNEGSYLTTYAEFGPFLAVLFWLVVGLAFGAMFTAMTRGSLPGLLAYSTLFIGILELPRFVYWTEGRTAPVILALVVIAIAYPRDPEKPRKKRFSGSLLARR